MTRRRALLVLAAGMAVVAAIAAPAQAGFPGANGKIVFASARDGNWEIYTMNRVGSAQQRLTRNRVRDAHPVFSPGGARIAFTRGAGRNAEIWVMNVDGTGQRRLTDNDALDGQPAWSPDGREIAFVSARDGNREIYKMKADGSDQERLTRNTNADADPAWSPDGTQIAFASNPESKDVNNPEVRNQRRDFAIWVMNADGTGQEELIHEIEWAPPGSLIFQPAFDADNRNPAWSPDGSKIVFSVTNLRVRGLSPRTCCDREYWIAVANADGLKWAERLHLREARRRNAARIRLGAPSWSPDGEQIVYWNTRRIRRAGRPDLFRRDIMVMSARDGSGKRWVAPRRANEHHPDWQPLPAACASDPGAPGVSGDVIFTSGRPGDREIYTMRADGRGLARLTYRAGLDGDAVFSPDGDRIAYTSRRGGNTDLCVMNADGTGKRRLTADAAPDLWPAWHPNGEEIVFASRRRENQFDLFRVDVESGEVTPLLHVPRQGFEGLPAYSPDGRRIAFVHERLRNRDIWVMDADGTGEPQRLTAHRALDSEPAWSPDGSRIAFSSTRNGNRDIYVMDADGSDVRRITDHRAVDVHPGWINDGMIVFASSRGGAFDLWAASANPRPQPRPGRPGSRVPAARRLTDHPATDSAPHWRPGAPGPPPVIAPIPRPAPGPPRP